jgi:hypothetical protein
VRSSGPRPRNNLQLLVRRTNSLRPGSITELPPKISWTPRRRISESPVLVSRRLGGRGSGNCVCCHLYQSFRCRYCEKCPAPNVGVQRRLPAPGQAYAATPGWSFRSPWLCFWLLTRLIVQHDISWWLPLHSNEVQPREVYYVNGVLVRPSVLHAQLNGQLLCPLRGNLWRRKSPNPANECRYHVPNRKIVTRCHCRQTPSIRIFRMAEFTGI